MNNLDKYQFINIILYLKPKDRLNFTICSKYLRNILNYRKKTLIGYLIHSGYQEGVRNGYLLYYDYIMFTNHNHVNSISELNGYHYDDQLTPNNVWFHSIEKLTNLSNKILLIGERY